MREADEWLDDDTWQRVQAAVPVACVDLLPVVRSRTGSIRSIGLIERTFPAGEHAEQVWCQIGGRIRREESLVQCASRHLGETLIGGAALGEVAPAAFFVNEYFSEPGKGPGYDPRRHAVAVCFLVEVAEEIQVEVNLHAESASLDGPRQVFAFKWFRPQDLDDSVSLWPGTRIMIDTALKMDGFVHDDLAYGALAARQSSQNEMMWQTPVLAMTAMAFLLIIALQREAATWSRVVAAFLAGTVALISLQLMARHSKLSREDEDMLYEIQRELGIRPIYRRGSPVPNRRLGFQEFRTAPFRSFIDSIARYRSRVLWLQAMLLFAAASFVIGLVILLIPSAR